jgi:hypothetical protein
VNGRGRMSAREPAAYLAVLLHAGWRPGAPTGPGTALHSAYPQATTATTATFAGIVACQIGTAFAARTERASLRSVGLFTNRLLLFGCTFELTFAAALIYIPVLQRIFGTAALPGWVLLMLVPFHSSYGASTRSTDCGAVGTVEQAGPDSPLSGRRTGCETPSPGAYLGAREGGSWWQQRTASEHAVRRGATRPGRYWSAVPAPPSRSGRSVRALKSRQ